MSMPPLPPLPPQPTLETARLRLRPFAADDAEALVRGLSEKAVADGTLRVPHPYPPERAQEFLADLAPRFEAGKAIQWAITRREDGRLVGGVGLTLARAHHKAELGYWIARDCWGQGFATEASAAVIAFAFGPLGLHRVDAHCYVENPASAAVMRKLGMTHEGRHRAAVWRDGVPRDLEAYAVLATD